MTEAKPNSDTVSPAPAYAAPGGDEFLSIEAVCRFFGGDKPLHPATIYRGIGTRYPRPVRVSPNVNRWLRSECEVARRAIVEAPREPLPSPRHRAAS